MPNRIVNYLDRIVRPRTRAILPLSYVRASQSVDARKKILCGVAVIESEAAFVIVVVPPVGSVIEVGREKGSVKVTEVVAPLASVAEVSKPA